MTIYRVVTPPVNKLDGEQKLVSSAVHVRFAPSEGAAKKFRRELAEAHGFKLNEVRYAGIDLKTGKAGFVAYMNAFHAQAPADYVPAGYPKAETPAKAAGKKKAAKKPIAKKK